MRRKFSWATGDGTAKVLIRAAILTFTLQAAHLGAKKRRGASQVQGSRLKRRDLAGQLASGSGGRGNQRPSNMLESEGLAGKVRFYASLARNCFNGVYLPGKGMLAVLFCFLHWFIENSECDLLIFPVFCFSNFF